MAPPDFVVAPSFSSIFVHFYPYPSVVRYDLLALSFVVSRDRSIELVVLPCGLVSNWGKTYLSLRLVLSWPKFSIDFSALNCAFKICATSPPCFSFTLTPRFDTLGGPLSKFSSSYFLSPDSSSRKVLFPISTPDQC